MPTKPKRPCAHPGCPELTDIGVSYCPKHKRIRQSHQQDNRLSPSQRGYNAKYRRIRAAQLREHPDCEQCGDPATTTHHIIPISEGGQHEVENLMSVCTACHNRIEKKKK